MGPPGNRDLDGDGTADLLWRNSRSGGVAVWHMMADSFPLRIVDRKVLNVGMIKTADFLAGVPLDWQIAGSGDLDGNGTADVIWRNSDEWRCCHLDDARESHQFYRVSGLRLKGLGH